MRKKYEGPTPDEFNAIVPVGTRVRYYPVLPADEDSHVVTFTRSAAWAIGGRTVVSLEDMSGGKDVTHLVVLGIKEPLRGIAGFSLSNT